MSGKTVIRFSESILSELPSIAKDAVLAYSGDVRAWIHIGERVIQAAGSTITMCIQHHNIQILTQELQIEKQNMQERADMEKAKMMEENRIKLLEIQNSMREEREKLEQYISEEKQRNEKMMRKGADTKDIERAVAQETEETIRMMRKMAAVKREATDIEGRKERKEKELYTSQKRYAVEIMRNVRTEIKKAIDLFDEKIYTNQILNELPQDARLRLDEQYRMLLWQYQKNIDI